MSTKANNSKSEAVRVVMTPLGSAASNVFNMLNMSFFLVFSTEALGLNITAMGIIMTVMRIFDGITDQLLVLLSTELKHDLVNSVRSL